MFLTNYTTVTCPTCSSILQVKNKNFSRLIGASGAVIEILVFLSLYLLHPHELLVIALWVALVPISAIVVVLTWIKLLRLKVKSQHA